MRVIAATAFLRLRKVRNRLAAVALQSHIVSFIEQKRAVSIKKSATKIEQFYRHNRFRKSLKKTLHERIEKKRELLAAEERLRREREEADRKEREIREAADLAKKAKREAEEKIRMEKEKMEEEIRERDRQQREAREKERKEQERKELELQEELHRARELEKKLRQEAHDDAARAANEIKAQKETNERLQQELEERKLALDLREFELSKREEVNVEIKKDTSDQMITLVKKGNSFFRHSGKIEEAIPVEVKVTDEGILHWVEPDTVDEGGKALQGDLNLRSVVRIKGGSRSISDDLGKDSTLFLTIEYRVDNAPSSKTELLQLQAASPDTRTRWMTALRYCVRNLKDLDTLSRPQGDLARGNILAAMFADTIEELKEKNKKLRAKLDEHEKKGRVPDGHLERPVPSSPDADAKVSALKLQVEDLKKKLKAAQGKKTPGASALIAEQKKILHLKETVQTLQEKNQVQAEENKRLRERLQVLEEELTTKRAVPFNDPHAARQHEEKVRAEWEKKYGESKESVDQAERAVQEAESAVKRRQEIIRKAMRALGEKKTQLHNTEQTMGALGISGRDPESLTDPTARRLAEMYRAQKKEQQDAEAELLKEYASMTAEAEALNEKNESLAKATLAKERLESLAQQLPFRSDSSSRLSISKPGAPGAPGVAPGTGKHQDDGCMIS